MQQVKQPFVQIADLDGSPLQDGKLYFGTANLNPEVNPVTVYWDSAATQPAAQPIMTMNGYPVRNGNIADIYAPSNYSMTARNKKGAVVFYKPNVDNDASLVGTSAAPGGLWTTVQGFIDTIVSSIGSSAVGFIQSGIGAVQRSVQAKLRDWVHVDDYGAVGDGVTNDTPAIQKAIDSGASRILFGQKSYRINACLNLTNRGTNPIKLVGTAAPYGGNGAPGAVGTTILGYTLNWMIDSTGSSFTEAEDMLLLGITSPGGWLQARSAVGSYALYNRMKKVYIYVPTTPAFSSAGSIALCCDNVENQVAEQCWFEGDTAYVTSMNNELGVASVYSTISTAINSNTDVTHRQCVYKGITGAGMLLIGQASSTYDQCFWQKAVVGNTYNHAIVTQNSTGGYLTCQKLRFSGQIEDYNYGFLLTNDTTNIEIDLTTAAVNTALVRLGGATNHYGLEVNAQTFTRTANKRVLDSSTASVANLYGGRIVVSDGGKLDSTLIKYIGTDLQMAAVDTHDNAKFNYAAGSTYTMSSQTTPLFASASFTPGTIVNGASFGGGTACTGARLGDFVRVSANIDLQGCSLTGYVSSADNVVAVINNNTGGSHTLGSATFKFVITQQ